uniref:Rab GTPase-binding effector protein 2 n=1 Tax=Apteryx owenii TaxID=8824 RepID=A0A8B9QKX7_APTOW
GESGEPDGSEQDAAPGAGDAEGTIQALRVQLAAALAEAETVRAVATVSESTKQEAVAAVRRQCQEEVASLQAILKDSIRSYEAQLAALRQEWRPAAPREPPPDSLELQMEKAQEDSRRLRSVVEPMEEEITQLRARLARAEGLIRELRGDPEGRLSPASADEAEEDDGLAFARGCDSLSIAGSVASSGAPAQDDTASLLSTATLVPESIYLPPPGFQLVPDGAWAQLQDEAGERLEAATRERQGLEEALRRSSEDCAKQVRVLLGQVQDSERLLQNLQATVSQTQRRTQEQMVGADGVWGGRTGALAPSPPPGLTPVLSRPVAASPGRAGRVPQAPERGGAAPQRGERGAAGAAGPPQPWGRRGPQRAPARLRAGTVGGVAAWGGGDVALEGGHGPGEHVPAAGDVPLGGTGHA